jgi:hypothetical protein
MIDGVSVQLSEATEASVRVTLATSGDVDLAGEWELYGPRCEYGRTLASTFRGRATSDGGVQFLVTEPCYWSPAMPFLYEVRRLGERDVDQAHQLGLRRLITHGRNLRLAGERIVLRGATCKSLDELTAREAHDAGCALALGAWNQPALEAASRFGTSALLDAAVDVDLLKLVEATSWQPAVAGILLDRQSLDAASLHLATASGILLAQLFNSQSWNDATSLSPNANLMVVNLAEGERPPAWMATCGRPVVAIRRGPTYADFEQARAGCDRLQAELAPEFDLAGYFAGESGG